MGLYDRFSRALNSNNLETFTNFLQSVDRIWERMDLKYINSVYMIVLMDPDETKIWLETLLNYGCPITSFSVHFAIDIGDVKGVEMLLSKATVELKRNLNVLKACAVNPKRNSKAVFELLINLGFDYEINRGARPPLYHAIAFNNIELINGLLLNGANPCLKYRSCCENDIFCGFSSLQFAFYFSLSSSSKEMIIKYAMLHLSIEKDQELVKFLKSGRARSFKKFACICMKEVITLEHLYLISNKLTLYDYMILQGKDFKVLDTLDITNRLFYILSSISLPIYKVEILRKAGRKTILNSFFDLHMNDCVIYSNELFLNSDCVVSICKYLNTEDVISLWLAMIII